MRSEITDTSVVAATHYCSSTESVLDAGAVRFSFRTGSEQKILRLVFRLSLDTSRRHTNVLKVKFKVNIYLPLNSIQSVAKLRPISWRAENSYGHTWDTLSTFPGPGRRHPAVVPVKKKSPSVREEE